MILRELRHEYYYGKPHADLLGPGILWMAQAQGQDITPLMKAMRAPHVPLKEIPQDAMVKTLRGMPEYCLRHNLPYGIAHNLTEDIIQEINLDFMD